MDKPWQAYLHLGIVHFMAFPKATAKEAVVETARQIAMDSFFNVLEMSCLVDEETIREVRQVLDIAQVTVGVAGQPGLLSRRLNLASTDENVRQQAISAMKTAVDRSYLWGARLLGVMDGRDSDPGPAQRGRCTDLLVNSLKQVCKYAQDTATDYVLTLSFENFDRTVDKKSLVGPTVEAAALAARVKENCPNFGLTIDMGHLPLLGETPLQALTTAKEHIVHCHIGNAISKDPQIPGYGDLHPRLGAPESHNDVNELVDFIQALVKTGYFAKELPTPMPIVSFEVQPQLPGETPDLVIANCKRSWEEAWAKA